jgi:hypothetical protein
MFSGRFMPKSLCLTIKKSHLPFQVTGLAKRIDVFLSQKAAKWPPFESSYTPIWGPLAFGGQGRTSRRSRLAMRSHPSAARARTGLSRFAVNRTTNTRIFRTLGDLFGLYLSTSYRGVRCLNCSTMHNDAQLIHANLTHRVFRSRLSNRRSLTS